MTSVSFGSMFNPERVGANKAFNPERNIEGFAHGDSERPKDFPAFLPDEQIKDAQARYTRSIQLTHIPL